MVTWLTEPIWSIPGANVPIRVVAGLSHARTVSLRAQIIIILNLPCGGISLQVLLITSINVVIRTVYIIPTFHSHQRIANKISFLSTPNFTYFTHVNSLIC